MSASPARRDRRAAERTLRRTPLGRQALDAAARIRTIVDNMDALRANDALFEAGRDARRRAQEAQNAGDHQEAARLLAEAETYEGAGQDIAGLRSPAHPR